MTKFLQKGFALLLCLSLLLGFLPTVMIRVEATEAVHYLDANGDQKYVTEYQPVSSTTSSMNGGWYVADGAFVLMSKITVTGDVHLILCDYASITVPGIQVSEGNSLTIYAQSVNADKMGKIISQGATQGQAGIGGFKGTNGTIVINGGNIHATGQVTFSAGIGGGSHSQYITRYVCGDIIINGGIVTANGGKQAAGIGGGFKGQGGNVTVNGGIVTAISANNGSGIGGGREAPGGNFVQNGGVVIASISRTDLSPGAVPIGNGSAGGSAGSATYSGGITFLSGTGKLNRNEITLDMPFYLPADCTLNVESGKTLTIADSGYIHIFGALNNNGTIVNNGGILNEGTFTNNGSGSCGLYAKDHPVVSGEDTCAFCGSVAAPKYYGGKYYVSEGNHLYWIAEQVNAGAITEKLDIVLVDDITLPADQPWSPIQLPDGQRCSFEGNRHTITMEQSYQTDGETGTGDLGLFSSLNYSTVKNLVLRGNFSCNTTGNVGVIAGTSYRTTYENVVSYVNVTNACTTGGSAGGIVGYYGGKHNATAGEYSKLINCAVYADVTGYYAGGLIGCSWNGTQYYDITGGLYVGNVTSNGGAAGAIVGYQETDSNTCTFTNVFWNETDGLGFYGKRDTENQVYNNTAEKTLAEFASGELAWILNNGVTDGTQAWYQDLQEDDYPQLSGPTVYSGYNHICKDTEIKYSNAADYLRDTPADHTYSSDCDTTCKFCDTVRVASASHTLEYQGDADGHWQVCTVCGDKTTSSEHSMGYVDNHNYTHSYVCAVCGYEDTSRWENHYVYYVDNGDGTHDRACSICDFSHKERNPHILVTTDRGDGSHITHCEKCPYTEQYPVVHSMIYEDLGDGTHVYHCESCDYAEAAVAHRIQGRDNGDGTHTGVCLDCGYTEEATEHSFTNGVCTGCGYVAPVAPAQKDGVYQIGTLGELMWFVQLVNGGTADASAELIADITVNEDLLNNLDAPNLIEWIPIGNEADFTGNFNGNFHTISGLYMKGTDTIQGFIGNYSDGTVSKLGIIDSYFDTDRYSCYVGGVVASNYGTVTQCWFDGSITIHGADAFCGGVVGYNGYEKLVEYCYNLGAISCNYNGANGGVTTVGGVVGQNFAGTIQHCYNGGAVTDPGGFLPSRVGSLVGNNYGYDYSSMGMGTGYAYATNCYTIYSDVDAHGGNYSQYATTDISEVSEICLADGSLTYMLNGWSSEGVWKQTLGEDMHPVFDGLTVYYDDENGGYTNEEAIVPGEPTEVEVKISHTVSFDSDLQMNYRIKLADILAAVPNYVTEGAYLEVEKDRYPMGGGEKTVETVTLYPNLTTDAERMLFNLAGIQSVEMGSELRAVLHFFDAEGNEYCTTVDTYSVLAYAELCFDYYDPATDGYLFTMLIDCLNYGSAAQVAFDRRADELVNAGLEAYQQYASTELSAELTDVRTYVDNDRTITAVTKMGFTVTFADKTEINAKLTIAEGYTKEDITSVKVLNEKGEEVAVLTDFTELDDGRIQVTFTGMKSVDMRNMYYFVAYVGNQVASQNVGYSIEAYAKSNIASDDTNAAALARACIFYGDSAKIYFESLLK